MIRRLPAALTLLLPTLVLPAAPASAQASRPEALLPPETIFYVGTDDVQAMREQSKSSALSKIMNEEEVQEFLKKPTSMIRSWLELGLQEMKNVPGLADVEIDPDKILAGAYGNAFVALTHVAMPPIVDGAPDGEPDLGLVIGLEARPGSIDLLQLLQQMVQAMISAEGIETTLELIETPAGSYQRMKLPDGPPIIFAKINGVSYLTISETTMHGMLECSQGQQESMLSSGAYQNCQQVAGSGAGGLPVFYFHVAEMVNTVRGILGVVAEVEGDEGAEIAAAVNRALDSLELGKVGPVYAVSGWKKGVAVTRSYAEVDPNAGGLCALVSGSKAIDPNILNLVPDRAISFTSFKFELEPLYTAIMNAVHAAAPEIHEQVVGHMNAFSGQISGTTEDGKPNWDIERDLIRALGGDVFWMSTPGQPTMFGPGVDTVGWIETSNPEGLARSLEYIFALPGQMADFPLTFKEQDHGGVKLKVLDVMSLGRAAMMAAAMQPTYAIHDGRLFFSTQTNALKKMLDSFSNPPEKNILSKEDFSRHYAQVNKKADLTALSYSDTAVDFENMYTGLMGVLPMVMMGAPITEDDLPIELSLMPTSESISQHLFGSLNVSYRLQDGAVLTESYGPFGAELGLVLAGGAGCGAAFFVMQNERSRVVAPVAVAPTGTVDKASQARSDLKEIKAAITVYVIEFGQPPSSLTDLEGPKPQYPSGMLPWDTLPKDPWGNDYQYEVGADGGFKVWSFGPNLANDSGGGDDIVESRR